MDSTSCKMAIAPAAAGAEPYARSAGTHAEKTPATASSSVLLDIASLIIRVAAMALLACSIARAAWQARGDPRDLAFIAGAGAVLAALFWCLRRAERLTPGSPAAERRRLQAAVWFLSTALSCAFAYRVSLVMPSAALVVLIWCMTSFVVLAGFVMLVLCSCEDQQYQYQCVDEVDAAGDAKPCNTDPHELV